MSNNNTQSSQDNLFGVPISRRRSDYFNTYANSNWPAWQDLHHISHYNRYGQGPYSSAPAYLTQSEDDALARYAYYDNRRSRWDRADLAHLRRQDDIEWYARRNHRYLMRDLDWYHHQAENRRIRALFDEARRNQRRRRSNNFWAEQPGDWRPSSGT